jgi:hypothetical protein
LTAAILGGDHWDARVYALLAVGVVRALPAGEDWREVWGRRCRRAPGPSGQPGWLIVSLGMLDAALAVVAGLAVLAARRANRRARVGPAT